MDFSGLIRVPGAAKTDDPLKLFDEAPKPPRINDLYKSQAEVLSGWYASQCRDAVIKMHTGGGKTLVGLLIAKSIMISTAKPVLYLCPNKQLVAQSIEKAKLYSIEAVSYPARDFPPSFQNAEAILIATYEALFNGESRFGTADGSKSKVDLGGIIIDDAHAAFNDVRTAFTYAVGAKREGEHFRELASLFRDDFEQTGRIGTFDAILSGETSTVLEVPYWAWKAKEARVRDLITAKRAKNDDGKIIDSERFFKWPFLRDELNACHALISQRGFTLTPFLPLVDEVPSYAECKKRIFMSATVNDDTPLIRTFKLDPGYSTFSAKGSTGIAERFAFAPAFTANFSSSYDDAAREVARYVSADKKLGVVVLAPSERSAKTWKLGEVVKGHDAVVDAIDKLNKRTSCGPIVFLNRYDGLDLPENACRLVVLWDLPAHDDDYDQYRATMLHGGEELAASVARTIEQGMGRGARGASDYCIVVFAGRSLESWIAKKSNLKHLSLATQIQVEIGRSVSGKLSDIDALKKAIDTVIARDKQWTTMHASRLSDLLEGVAQEAKPPTIALAERKAFDLFITHRYGQSRIGYEELASKSTDKRLTAWYLQLAGRAALYDGDTVAFERLQNDANGANDRFVSPPRNRRYLPVSVPTDQSRAIAAILSEHEPLSATLLSIADDLAFLNTNASANQFEQSLSDLGHYLGFNTQRPDKSDRIGPDVLWIADQHAFVLEAKSRKLAQNKIIKGEVGQLLTSAAWFEEKYPGMPYTHAIVAPNIAAEDHVPTANCSALSMTALLRLVEDLKQLYGDAAASPVGAALEEHVAALLRTTSLMPNRLVGGYFVPLSSAQK